MDKRIIWISKSDQGVDLSKNGGKSLEMQKLLYGKTKKKKIEIIVDALKNSLITKICNTFMYFTVTVTAVS